MSKISKEEIQKKINKINSDIAILTSERESLEKTLLIMSSTFEEKFDIWVESNNKKDEPWLIGGYLREWYDKHRELQRYRTYNVLDDLDEDLMFLLDPSGYEEEIEDYPEYAKSVEEKEFLLKVAKQIMEENIGTFVCDW